MTVATAAAVRVFLNEGRVDDFTRMTKCCQLGAETQCRCAWDSPEFLFGNDLAAVHLEVHERPTA